MADENLPTPADVVMAAAEGKPASAADYLGQILSDRARSVVDDRRAALAGPAVDDDPSDPPEDEPEPEDDDEAGGDAD